MEISPFQKLRVFAEYTVAAYLTSDANLVQQALFSQDDHNSSQAGYIFITPFIFDFLDIRLGVRIQL